MTTEPDQSTPNAPVPNAPGPIAVATPERRVQPKANPDRPVPWNVVLLDDQDHSYEYVIEMVQKLFGMSAEAAYNVAKRVDSEGRAVVMTTHKERAEFKAAQIMGFGKDFRIASCAGSMSAIIEPAEGEGDGADR
jgi:ATP-dependent Clp protease adaptor protein ClpS